MKTAIYIEDGVMQLVLTPETQFEQNAIQVFGHQPITAQVFQGGFYNCLGGWVRHEEQYSTMQSETYGSLIVKLQDKQLDNENKLYESSTSIRIGITDLTQAKTL